MTRRRFLRVVGAVVVGGATVGALELARLAAPQGVTPVKSTSSPTAGAVGSVGAAPRSAGAAATAVPAVGSAGASPTPGPRLRYRSRPDLAQPLVQVTRLTADVAPGLVFLTPTNGAGRDGPTIIDNTGGLIWMRPDTGKNSTDFRVASYRGAPVLTWWEGTNNAGIGSGEHVIADASYRELARIRGANGRQADLHELQLTDRGTALFLADAAIAPSLPAGATPAPWMIMDCAIQEVDIATGRLLFEWHTAPHIDLAESYVAPPATSNVVHDYVHANSIDVDTDGNLLMSARNTSAVYKIDRQSGRILWRLGGSRSDFAMGPGARFGYQHDARRQADGTLTIFDDGQAPGQSRAIVLRLDEVAMTASLVREYAQPEGLLATSQGNMQVLPNGNVFIGWGSLPRFSEYSTDGRLLYDATFTSTQSYRDYRFPWVGRPADVPAIALDAAGGSLTVYASWNGATGIASWDLFAGASPASLGVATSAPRSGFETAITLRETPASVSHFVAVRARDASGAVLGMSPVVSTIT